MQLCSIKIISKNFLSIVICVLDLRGMRMMMDYPEIHGSTSCFLWLNKSPSMLYHASWAFRVSNKRTWYISILGIGIPIEVTQWSVEQEPCGTLEMGKLNKSSRQRERTLERTEENVFIFEIQREESFWFFIIPQNYSQERWLLQQIFSFFWKENALFKFLPQYYITHKVEFKI